MSSAIGLKACVITAGIRKYKSIIKNKKKWHDKILSLANNKIDTIKVLFSQALVHSNITHDEFVSIKKTERIWWYGRRHLKFQ